MVRGSSVGITWRDGPWRQPNTSQQSIDLDQENDHREHPDPQRRESD